MKKQTQFTTIANKIAEVKQEIRDRKKWRTALINEYGKARTFKEHREQNIITMLTQASIMIKHNEIILQEYQEMLKALEHTEKKIK